jgi:hypothetical protein
LCDGDLLRGRRARAYQCRVWRMRLSEACPFPLLHSRGSGALDAFCHFSWPHQEDATSKIAILFTMVQVRNAPQVYLATCRWKLKRRIEVNARVVRCGNQSATGSHKLGVEFEICRSSSGDRLTTLMASKCLGELQELSFIVCASYAKARMAAMNAVC